MIRLKDTKHASTADFLGDAVRIAEYYGFVPLEEALREARRPQPAPSAKNDQEISFARREERPLAQIARRVAQIAHGSGAPARLLWRISQGSAAVPAQSLELHIAGTSSAIAEALLIVVASAIAQESGITQRVLSINNIGSHESSNRFVRDVGTYLRKHIESISPTLRPRAATDPLGTLVQLIERGHPGIARAPQAMEYLTEEERRRFWELLEYLELSEIPYELSPHILGSRDCWAHSLFEISTIDTESEARIPIAFGGRYDPLASRFFGRSVPAAMISIMCEVRGKTRVKRDVPGLPAMYFAHLGLDAKRRALPVLEMLRKAEIPVYQSLTFERIGEQMAQAKSLAVPYVIIMGYKEATEGTVLVREVATNSQEAVPVPELPNYLRRHRVGNWKAEARS
jgi:histidyl-tRNA synthetase